MTRKQSVGEYKEAFDTTAVLSAFDAASPEAQSPTQVKSGADTGE